MSDYHFPFLRAVLILECRRTSFLPLGPDLQQDARQNGTNCQRVALILGKPYNPKHAVFAAVE